MLNVRHLAVFRAVVKAGSVSAAARRLYISQPAITKTVRLLEEELGLAMFLRVKGRLVLTPEAEILMPEVERLFGNVAAVKDLAEEIRDGFSGSVSVATLTTLSATLVAKAVERLLRQYPRVRFDIRALSTRLVVDAVATHQVDVGIADDPTRGVEVEVIELCRSEIACVIRAGHALAVRRRLGPKDIAKETLISFSDETQPGWQLRHAFHKAHVDRNVGITVNHTHTAYALVQSGVGIGVVDSFPMLSGSFPDLRIVQFRPLMETAPHVLLSKTRAVPLVARKFVAILKETTQDMIARSNGLLRQP